MKKCFIWIVTKIYDQALMNQYFQKCSSTIVSGLRIEVENKELHSDIVQIQL